MRESVRYCGGLLLVAGGWLAGCAKVDPATFQYELNAETKKLPAEVQQQIRETTDQRFGTPGTPKIDGTQVVDAGKLERGSTLYRQLCLHCHGLSGGGNGPTAAFLWPRPRDYRQGKFKFTSTASGARVVRDDLIRTLREGIPGTSMPSFVLYGAEDLEALANYVMLLSIRGQLEGLLALRYTTDGQLDQVGIDDDVSFVFSQWSQAASQIVKPETPKPPLTPESVARGQAVWVKADCVKCHGPLGKGDGPSAAIDPLTKKPIIDDWGNVSRPADLTRGMYHGGRRPIDLYRRVYAGIKGTIMPGFGATLKPDEIWDLVNFIQNMPYGEAAPAAAPQVAGVSGG